MLANEAGDLELELVDLYRNYIKKYIGNAAIDTGWKVELLSPTEVIVYEGEGWFEGFPFQNRGANDQLVSGSILDKGEVYDNLITVEDYMSGSIRGKKINFPAGTTAENYQIIISAEEQIVYSSGSGIVDPFLRNYNVPEDTANKFRTLYKINVLPVADQTTTPTPYAGYYSASNKNLTNYIEVVTSSVIVADITDVNQQRLDGRRWDITVVNTSSRFPVSVDDRSEFENGKLIDNNGNTYHLISIRNSSTPGSVVLRIDDEVGQDEPTIAADGLTPFYLYKKDIFYADSSTGIPQGRLYWPIANVNVTSSGISHSSEIVDLRNRVLSASDFRDIVKAKFTIKTAGGGDIQWQYSGGAVDIFSFSSAFSLINPAGVTQTIPAASSAIMDGGCLAYEMNLAGGSITRGISSVTIASGSTTLVLSGSPDLSLVRLGNVIRSSAGAYIAYITEIDDLHDTITVSSSFGAYTGPATIFRNSFGPGQTPVTENTFILAARSGTKLYLCDGTELEAGERTQMGYGISSATLQFIGANDKLDSDPLYPYTNFVVQGSNLPTAIGRLDLECQNIYDVLNDARVYDERILYPTGLVSGTVIHIPVNSRTSLQQTFNVERSQLEIYVNQLFKFQGTDPGGLAPADWFACDSLGVEVTSGDAEYIILNFDLANDTEVHFRYDTLGGVTSGGSGSSDLQDAYNNGASITTSVGNPVSISGPAGSKLFEVNGDMTCTGIIDPKGIEITPESSNPLGSGKLGIWINTSEELVFEKSTESQNITKKIEDIESGFGVEALGVIFTNNTGSTINKFTPVYSPIADEIAVADGTDDAKARVVGITAEDIADGNTGTVLIIGKIDISPTTLTHGKYIYLGLTPGELVDTAPTLLGGYPEGFDVILVGLLVGSELILRFQHMGTLG